MGGQRPVHAPAVTVGGEHALARRAGQGLSRRLLLDAQGRHRLQERGRPHRTGTRVHELAEHGEQQRAGTGEAHLATTVRGGDRHRRSSHVIRQSIDATSTIRRLWHMTILDSSTEPDAPAEVTTPPVVDFDTAPDRYRHWTMAIEGAVATLTLGVDEDGGLVPGYQLKTNSYDLGVDIELYDAVQRLRFEHPQVKAVVITGGLDQMFCAGANIRMLAQSSHAWKVNFCKFTNETRNGIEDATASLGPDLDGRGQRHGRRRRLRDRPGLRRDRADRRRLVDGLPARGAAPRRAAGHRRPDPRRRQAPRPQDRADLFATKSEGFRGQHRRRVGTGRRHRAQAGLGRDDRRAGAGAAEALRPRPGGPGVALTPLARTEADATRSPTPTSPPRIDRAAPPGRHRGARARDDPPADAAAALRAGRRLVADGGHPRARRPGAPAAHQRDRDSAPGSSVPRATPTGCWPTTPSWPTWHDWFVTEVRHYWKRTLKRLDVTSRSLIAVIEPGCCFAGMLPELALACDRQYMLDGVYEDVDPDAEPATIVLTAANDGAFPMGNGLSRLGARFCGRDDLLEAARKCDRRAARRRARPTSSGWSRWRSTTSTSRRSCGSCSRSAPRSRPTR